MLGKEATSCQWIGIAKNIIAAASAGANSYFNGGYKTQGAERENIVAEQTGIGETLSPEALSEAQDKAETLKLAEPMSQLVNTMPKSFDAIKYIYAQIAKWFGAEAADFFLELLDKEKEEDDGCS